MGRLIANTTMTKQMNIAMPFLDKEGFVSM